MTFFCFKQKTAYEMLIVDWSSDVCSSDLRQGVDIGNAGTDRDRLRRFLDSLQFGDAARVDHRLRPLKVLGHPEADIGRTRRERCLRMGRVKFGQRSEAGRREEAPGTVAGLYCVAVLQRRKRLDRKSTRLNSSH